MTDAEKESLFVGLRNYNPETLNILNNQFIKLFNEAKNTGDFTAVENLVSSVSTFASNSGTTLLHIKKQCEIWMKEISDSKEFISIKSAIKNLLPLMQNDTYKESIMQTLNDYFFKVSKLPDIFENEKKALILECSDYFKKNNIEPNIDVFNDLSKKYLPVDYTKFFTDLLNSKNSRENIINTLKEINETTNKLLYNKDYVAYDQFLSQFEQFCKQNNDPVLMSILSQYKFKNNFIRNYTTATNERYKEIINDNQFNETMNKILKTLTSSTINEVYLDMINYCNNILKEKNIATPSIYDSWLQMYNIKMKYVSKNGLDSKNIFLYIKDMEQLSYNMLLTGDTQSNVILLNSFAQIVSTNNDKRLQNAYTHLFNRYKLSLLVEKHYNGDDNNKEIMAVINAMCSNLDNISPSFYQRTMELMKKFAEKNNDKELIKIFSDYSDVRMIQQKKELNGLVLSTKTLDTNHIIELLKNKFNSLISTMPNSYNEELLKNLMFSFSQIMDARKNDDLSNFYLICADAYEISKKMKAVSQGGQATISSINTSLGKMLDKKLDANGFEVYSTVHLKYLNLLQSNPKLQNDMKNINTQFVDKLFSNSTSHNILNSKTCDEKNVDRMMQTINSIIGNDFEILHSFCSHKKQFKFISHEVGNACDKMDNEVIIPKILMLIEKSKNDDKSEKYLETLYDNLQEELLIQLKSGKKTSSLNKVEMGIEKLGDDLRKSNIQLTYYATRFLNNYDSTYIDKIQNLIKSVSNQKNDDVVDFEGIRNYFNTVCYIQSESLLKKRTNNAKQVESLVQTCKKSMNNILERIDDYIQQNSDSNDKCMGSCIGFRDNVIHQIISNVDDSATLDKIIKEEKISNISEFYIKSEIPIKKSLLEISKSEKNPFKLSYYVNKAYSSFICPKITTFEQWANYTDLLSNFDHTISSLNADSTILSFCSKKVNELKEYLPNYLKNSLPTLVRNNKDYMDRMRNLLHDISSTGLIDNEQLINIFNSSINNQYQNVSSVNIDRNIDDVFHSNIMRGGK